MSSIQCIRDVLASSSQHEAPWVVFVEIDPKFQKHFMITNKSFHITPDDISLGKQKLGIQKSHWRRLEIKSNDVAGDIHLNVGVKNKLGTRAPRHLM